MSRQVSRGSAGEYQANEQAAVGGSAGEYQPDEPAGVARYTLVKQMDFLFSNYSLDFD